METGRVRSHLQASDGYAADALRNSAIPLYLDSSESSGVS